MKYEVWAKSLLAGTKGKLVIRCEICELGGLEVLITEQYEGQFTVSSWFSPRTSCVHLTTCVWGWSMVISKAEGKRGDERETDFLVFHLYCIGEVSHTQYTWWVSESQTWGFLCLTGEISLSQAPCKWPVGRFGYSQSFQNKLQLWAQEQNFPKRRTAKQDTDDGLHQGLSR